jgi:hypothetical protein
MKSYLETEDHEDNQNTSRQTSAFIRRRCKTNESDNQQNDEDGREPNEVNRPPTKLRHYPPCDEAPD